ncbi:MAG: AsmA family protein [bacterium]
MNKVLNLLGISFSLILVLLLILPFFFKVDDLRPEIEKKAGEALHAKLHLGRLGLKLFPSLSIFADDVSVTSLDKRFPETFLKGNSFRMEIPFLSLIGAPRVVVKINRPEVFIVKKNQIFNFESFLTSSEKKAEISQDSKTSSPFLLKKIQNASLNLEMTEAKVTYQNGDEKADIFLKELSLKNLSILAPVEILLASDLHYSKDSMELKGPFDFRGEVIVTPHGESLNAKFKLNGNFSDMKMKLSSGFEKAERVPLKLSFEGGFKGSDSSLEVNPIHFTLDKSDLKLNVKVLGFQNPQVKVYVQSKSLDLSSFMKKNASNSSGGISKNASSEALDESLTSMAPAVESLGKNPLFQKMKLDMSLNVSSLKTPMSDISNFRFLGNLASGNFKITQASLEGYGGKLNLSGFTQINSQVPAFNYGLKIQNIDLEKLITAHAPAWKGQLGGRFVADAQVSGLGLRKDQLSKNLKGSIEGEIFKGNTSLQLSKVISTLMKQLPQKPDLKGSASENQLKGKFKTLKLESQIAGRKINFKNLEIAYEADQFNLGEMEFKAEGALSFDKQLDIRGNVFLSPQIIKWPEAIGKSGKIEIPVALSGQMDEARADVGYTISKMGSRVVKKTLEKELTKGIQNLLKGQKPGDLLKSIFK